MNKFKGQISMEGIMALIVFIMFAVAVAVPIISSLVTQATTLSQVNNETINLSQGVPAVYQVAERRISAGTITINAENDSTRVLVLATNYTISSLTDGQFNIIDYDVEEEGPDINFTYQFEPTSYASDSTTRTLLQLFVLLFAVGVLVIVATSFGLVNMGG